MTSADAAPIGRMPIEREARAHEKRLTEIREQQRAAAAAENSGDQQADVEPVDDVDGELEDEHRDEPQAV